MSPTRSSLLLRSRRPSLLMLPCAVGLVACGSSHAGEADGGVDARATFDAAPSDGAPVELDADLPDATVRDSAPRSVCGDGMLDPMEQCDDGNVTDGDGCTSECRREAFCGDGMPGPDEVCDDGNNRSGDGCRSDCASDESCGNELRDVIVGEVCDDGNTEDGDGCSADCRSLELCGNSSLDPEEECDEGDAEPWDGCGPDCRTERSLIIDSLEIGGRGVGCDFTGDGETDNSLAQALTDIGVDQLNEMFIRDSIADGDAILLLSLLGLDDPAARADSSLTVGWLGGVDSDDDPGNNFSGMAELLVDPGTLDENRLPAASFQSRIMMSRISGGPEDVSLPLGPFPFDVMQARLHGTMTRSGGEVSGIDAGLLCGGMPLVTFAFLPNFVEMFGDAPPPACDGRPASTSMADLLVGGTPRGFIFPLRGTPPDVDIDGDGLESFEVDRSPPEGESDCQPVITACIDGDGTRIEGRDCALDPAIGDGYSTGLPFTAVRAQIVGVAE